MVGRADAIVAAVTPVRGRQHGRWEADGPVAVGPAVPRRTRADARRVGSGPAASAGQPVDRTAPCGWRIRLGPVVLYAISRQAFPVVDLPPGERISVEQGELFVRVAPVRPNVATYRFVAFHRRSVREVRRMTRSDRKTMLIRCPS